MDLKLPAHTHSCIQSHTDVYTITQVAHYTPALQSLHQLPVAFQMYFKVLVLTYKAVHGPIGFVGNHFLPHAPLQSLRSAKNNLLQVPSVCKVCLAKIRGKWFSIVTSQLWNPLLLDACQRLSLAISQKQSKTFYLGRCS